MELWTDYEGRTIDDFPLKKLLRPEGRSAFYATSTGKGDPTVIRLIESHFDEDEILARWRGVEALGHPNVLKLEHFGQIVIDDTTVLYAVMEPVEANLDEVVASHRVAVSDVRQLASSLASALDALHTHGFVHEHIEPENVFAVGEVVKLRSDCIREAPEGEDGRRAKRRDVHDLAVLLLVALTQERTLEAASRFSLPAPLDEIVSKGMSAADLAHQTGSAGKCNSPSRKRNCSAGAGVSHAHPNQAHGKVLHLLPSSLLALPRAVKLRRRQTRTPQRRDAPAAHTPHAERASRQCERPSRRW